MMSRIVLAALVAASPAHAAPTSPRTPEAPTAVAVEEPVSPPSSAPSSAPSPATSNAKSATSPAPARPAEVATTVLLLPLLGVEELDEPTLLTVQEALLQGLGRESWRVRDGSQLGELRDCVAAACLAAAGTEYAVRVRVRGSDRDYDTRIELLEVKTAQVVATSDEHCELCGSAELREHTANQAARVAATLAARLVAPPELVLTSEPSGAFVYIDGALVGRTPVQRRVSDGGHDVRVELDEHVPEQRRITATAGVRDAVHFTLGPTPARARSRALGLALVITGAAAAAAGVALLVLDARPVLYRCDGELVDGAGECRYVYNTDVGGAGLLAAGALATGGGAVLLRRTGRRGVQAALAPGGLRLNF